jgi:elongation factor 2
LYILLKKGANMLVDTTKGVQYLNEIKDSVVSGFMWSTKQGVLCEEEMRGIKFNLVDACHYSDAIHRGGGQIIPTTRRVLYACQLTSKPSLQEPYYIVDILTNRDSIGKVYMVLNKRRGVVTEEKENFVNPYVNITAYLPVSESFDFQQDLRISTKGMAFQQSYFDHYNVINGDIDDPNSNLSRIVKKIRLKKGMKEEIPLLENYLDKL